MAVKPSGIPPVCYLPITCPFCGSEGARFVNTTFTCGHCGSLFNREQFREKLTEVVLAERSKLAHWQGILDALSV